jgi:hypothetical protein
MMAERETGEDAEGTDIPPAETGGETRDILLRHVRWLLEGGSDEMSEDHYVS